MKKKLLQATYIIYISCLIYLLFFYKTKNYSRLDTHQHSTVSINLIPLNSIKSYARSFPDYYHHHGMSTWFMNVGGNIFMYFPFGFLLPMIWTKTKAFWLNVFIACLFSVTTEFIQFVFKVGILDIDDVILNMLGTTLGWLTYYTFIPFLSPIKSDSKCK